MRLLIIMLSAAFFASLSTPIFSQQLSSISKTTEQQEYETPKPEAEVLLEQPCPKKIIGASCSDGNDCTVNDAYNDNCDCVGILKDADKNGICDADEEENGSGFDVGGELVSRYLWRGIAFSNAPAIQPSLSYTFQKNDFALEIGSWGSYAFNADAGNEADLYFNASYGPVSIGLTDYFYPFDFDATNNLIKVVARACGYDDISKFNHGDLSTYNRDINKLTGINYAGI